MNKEDLFSNLPMRNVSMVLALKIIVSQGSSKRIFFIS